jgi:hypothetical protein
MKPLIFKFFIQYIYYIYYIYAYMYMYIMYSILKVKGVAWFFHSLSNHNVIVTSLQLLKICVDSSQSHRQPSTYFPGLMSLGIFTLSKISTRSFHSPEHLHVERPGVYVVFLHSSSSSQTGSKLGPNAFQSVGARGIGFLRQLEPAGVVPSAVSQPSATGS